VVVRIEDEVGAVLGNYLEIVDDLLPGFVEGLYVVGSMALGDWTSGLSDLDIVAVSAEPATDEDAGSLRTAHAILTEQLPRPFVDGPYLAWADLTVAPATGLHRPWSLDGLLHHDSECFEINPVTWFTLATYGRTVRGPAPAKLGIWLSVEDRIRFVIDNVRTYWSDVANDVARACTDPTAAFSSESFQWCALGALRLHYTAFTGDVTSKRGAGEYGLDILPEQLRDVVSYALELRARADDVAVIDAATMAEAAAVIEWVSVEVEQASAATGR
jgi:hypothetical protein